MPKGSPDSFRRLPHTAWPLAPPRGCAASVDDANVNAYCSLDADGKRLAPLTLGEKEQIFLEALSSYYYDGKPSISDQEFDNLKDELLWSGSKVAVLRCAAW